MSRHHYFVTRDEEEIHILMGWDQPLQYFFMVIEKEGDQIEPFWSNLNDDYPFQKNLNYYRQILEKFKISVPEEMLEEIERDAIDDIGNKKVVHELIDGKYTREEKSLSKSIF